MSDSDFKACRNMEDAAVNPRDELTVFQASEEVVIMLVLPLPIPRRKRGAICIENGTGH